MGGCNGKPASSEEEVEANRAITKELFEDRKRLENEVKLLLLGAGESGKSTIFKQMKIIHMSGFTEEERLAFKSVIFNNTVGSMRVLVTACQEFEIEISEENRAAAERMSSGEQYFTGEITDEIAADITAMWKDEGIRKAFQRSSEFQLNDSAAYYFENADRLAKPDYVPTDQDILRSRAKTTGIVEVSFKVENLLFRMIDVGGQRSERKKWLHCFQDVTSAVFCVSLSEYDLKLYEDDVTNRMHESLRLFREICNNKWFRETAMILFLNKDDLFREKIKNVDLSVCFPKYTGGCDYENALQYVKDQFILQNENGNKEIYVHSTTATDTKNIDTVFQDVKDIILKQYIGRDMGV